MVEPTKKKYFDETIINEDEVMSILKKYLQFFGEDQPLKLEEN